MILEGVGGGEIPKKLGFSYQGLELRRIVISELSALFDPKHVDQNRPQFDKLERFSSAIISIGIMSVQPE